MEEKARSNKAPTPKTPFEVFYKGFAGRTVRELTESPEWKDVYSHYYHFSATELDIKILEPEEETAAYDPAKQVQEIIRCAQSFQYFAHKYAKIQHPVHGLIPCIMYKYQQRVVEDYGRNRFNIISKFRQGGLTTISTVWADWRCLFMTDQRIMVLSKTDREAMAAGENARLANEHLPKWMLPTMGDDNKHERQFKDTGSALYFYTPEAIRGKSPTILIIDEAAFIQDMDRHWKAMFPAISTGGSCIVISTVNGVGNWYEHTYHEAQRGDNDFHLIDLDYWEHPLYNDPKWVNTTRATLGEKGWQQEVLRSFLGSGDTFISTDIIKDLDRDTKDNLPTRIRFKKFANKATDRQKKWDEGALWIWQEPAEGHDYIFGVDAAEGVGDKGDSSCFQVIDQMTQEQVAEFYSNSVQPAVFAQILAEFGKYYFTATLVVESQGQGASILNTLEHTLSYENIFYDAQSASRLPGLKTLRNNRPILLEILQSKLSTGALRVNSARFVHELKTFIYNSRTKKVEAGSGSHDDAIMAMCMALYARDILVRSAPLGIADGVKPTAEAFKSAFYEDIRREILEGAEDEWANNDALASVSVTRNQEELGEGFEARRTRSKLLAEFGW